MKRGSNSEGALDRDGPSVGFDDSVHDCQSEPSAFPNRLGGEERFKDSIERCRGHSCAVICDGKTGELAGDHFTLDLGCLQGDTFQRDNDGA